MNLLNALREDKTAAGVAALADYLIDHGEQDAADLARCEANVFILLRQAAAFEPGTLQEIRLNDRATINLIRTKCQARVTILVDGRRQFRVSIASVSEALTVRRVRSSLRSLWALKDKDWGLHGVAKFLAEVVL
jgi:hypothetical protein